MKDIEINQDLLNRLDIVTHQLEKISESLVSYNKKKNSKVMCSKCGTNCPERKRIKYYHKEEREFSEWRCISCSLPGNKF